MVRSFTRQSKLSSLNKSACHNITEKIAENDDKQE
jgi:hypothetical protein